MTKIFDLFNVIVATFVTILSAIFGEFWWAFTAFALFNAADWITGWLKARHFGKENSVAGVKGIIKKLSYWGVIGIAFFMSYGFTQIGDYVGVDFGWTEFIGWFVFISFIINEIRSILENFIEMDADWVPKWLMKGLEVAADKINNIAGGDDLK